MYIRTECGKLFEIQTQKPFDMGNSEYSYVSGHIRDALIKYFKHNNKCREVLLFTWNDKLKIGYQTFDSEIVNYYDVKLKEETLIDVLEENDLLLFDGYEKYKFFKDCNNLLHLIEIGKLSKVVTHEQYMKLAQEVK